MSPNRHVAKLELVLLDSPRAKIAVSDTDRFRYIDKEYPSAPTLSRRAVQMG